MRFATGTALGGMAADVQPLSRWKIDEPVTMSEGVLFVTYPTLRSGRGDATRLDQIIAWAADDFDGVIAFDEAHEMGGVAGGEGAMGTKAGSLQGIAGVLLQNRLPAARVLYASATGASEVNNLAYAVRLGLWGPETSFADREAFISEIRQGGIAAMELVARDLKATGLYTARALSFAGVEYDILRHELTPDQIDVYDRYADAWGIIHRNMEKALEITGVVDAMDGATKNAGAKAAARSRFESCKQRFFGSLLLSCKLPTVLAAVRQHLDAGQSVVLQLVSTAEAILNRRLGELTPDERAELDIDLSPREAVIDYLTRAFPVQQMRDYRDDAGEVRSRPLIDDDGHAVTNPEAEAARDDLIEQLCALPPIAAVLDGVLTYFGHDTVAEVTGRTKRLVPAANGTQKLETRSGRSTQADAAAFMAGTKRILVFSDAGGTGRSYHASLDALNQEQRASLSPRDTGDAVRRACAGVCLLRRCADARHLRQHEDGGHERVHGQGACLQPALPGHGQPLHGRADRLLAGVGLGERSGREPGANRTRPLLPATPAIYQPRGAERLAGGRVSALGRVAPASRAEGTDGCSGLGCRAQRAPACCRTLRRLS